MFTFSRATRALAIAGTAAAMAAAPAVTAATPLQEPAQSRSTDQSADVDRALATERYYSSYGDPPAIAPARPLTSDDPDWPLIGLVGAGGLLLGFASATAFRRVRVRRGAAGVPA